MYVPYVVLLVSFGPCRMHSELDSRADGNRSMLRWEEHRLRPPPPLSSPARWFLEGKNLQGQQPQPFVLGIIIGRAASCLLLSRTATPEPRHRMLGARDL